MLLNAIRVIVSSYINFILSYQRHDFSCNKVKVNMSSHLSADHTVQSLQRKNARSFDARFFLTDFQTLLGCISTHCLTSHLGTVYSGNTLSSLIFTAARMHSRGKSRHSRLTVFPNTRNETSSSHRTVLNSSLLTHPISLSSAHQVNDSLKETMYQHISLLIY